MEFSEVSFLADSTRPAPRSRAISEEDSSSPCKVDLVLFQKADSKRLQQATNTVAFLLAKHLREYHRISFALEMRRYACSVSAAATIQRSYRAYLRQRNATLLRWLQQWRAVEEQAARHRTSLDLTPRSASFRLSSEVPSAEVKTVPAVAP
eukprot:RCo016058